MNPNGQMIEMLANSQTFSEYERAFGEVTGLPITLRPVQSWQLPFHGKRKENPWCAMMAGKSRTCATCLQMQEKLASLARNESCTLVCAYGLCETAVPVKLGSETIAYLQTGQALQQNPTEESFQRAFEQVEALGIKVSKEKAREAYLSTPVVPQKKLDSISSLLSIFAEHLSMRSNQIAVQTANAEPPVISRAKQYIRENYTEDLDLARVAQAVHTSTIYFCKLFKNATGINFTNYVTRVRTEKAKDLLLNPNLRVSEVAYQVGFQSLTHFNRVFKKIVGESPSAFRNHLPKAA